MVKGRTLGRYELVECLGRGGMGEVWRARDPALRRDVAVKVLRNERRGAEGETLRDEFVQRFLREARSAASLKHPNVVAIHDVGVEAEPYIVMEHVEGATLRRYVGDASVPVATRLAWLVEIAEALAAAHAMGLVHRDVKPDNVMIAKDGHAKVLDFGIAKEVATEDAPVPSSHGAPASFRTQQGRVVGTPRYMAPEQVDGRPVDARADQWAWACVAYEILLGRVPDRDETPVPVSLTISEVPFDVAAAIVRARDPDPERRFPSMRALLDAIAPPTTLDRAPLATPQPSTHDPDAPTTTGPPRRSRRRPIALVAIASFLLSGVAVFALHRRAPPPHVTAAPPACTFAPLSGQALGDLGMHFASQAQSSQDRVILGLLRGANLGRQEMLVTVTREGIASRVVQPDPNTTQYEASTVFVMITPTDARHYVVYRTGDGDELVVGRLVANDEMVDASRLVALDVDAGNFEPSFAAGVLAPYTDPPSVGLLVGGYVQTPDAHQRAAIRFTGRNVMSAPVVKETDGMDVTGFVTASGAHRVGYAFANGPELFAGTFAPTSREDQVDQGFGIMVARTAVDLHTTPPVRIGKSAVPAALAFAGDDLWAVWPDVDRGGLHYAVIRSAGDAGVETGTLDAPTDGSRVGLVAQAGVFALAWRDGAHVHYGEGATLASAVARATAWPEPAGALGPWIARGPHDALVAWMGGPTNEVRRAIVTCR